MDNVLIAVQNGYKIDKEGNILNRTGNRIGGSVKNSGYKIISVRHNNKKSQCSVHRLQAFQKYGNRIFEPGVLVRHKDGNPLNNSEDNIRLGTQKDNMLDIPQEIRIKRAKHAASFNKKYDRKEVQEYHKKSKSYKKTMEHFNISSKGTLNYVLS